MFDVIVIGAGSVGCSAARELSRYQLKVLVLERGHDICSGASKANTGMIHPGYDPIPGTNKAKYNVSGNRMMYQICDELSVPYEKSGTTIFATDEAGLKELDKLMFYAEKNHVRASILTGEAMRRVQPNLGEDVKAVFYAPEGGVTSPFAVTFALAENACRNGAEFRVDAEVIGIERTGQGFAVKTKDARYETRMVINAAGLYADKVNDMVAEHTFTIIPRFGAHLILDRKLSEQLKTSLMETPHDLPGGGHTKGMAIVPTTGGTMLLGCDATEMLDRDTTETNRNSLEQIADYFKKAWPILPWGQDGSAFPMDKVISVFGGCRPHPDNDDFVIGEPKDCPGFVNAGGTESPAFTSCYAIGSAVAKICTDRLKPERNEAFDPYRKAKPAFRSMSNEERIQAIQEDPDYGKIVCRCEMVTEAEIREAIRRPLGARSIAGVKMRTRAGMGRCQGGFCGPRVLEILCEELGLDPLEVTQTGGESNVLVAKSGELE